MSQLAKEYESLQKKHEERVAEGAQASLSALAARLTDLEAQLKRERAKREVLEATRNDGMDFCFDISSFFVLFLVVWFFPPSFMLSF
jgi:hypothetical protein